LAIIHRGDVDVTLEFVMNAVDMHRRVRCCEDIILSVALQDLECGFLRTFAKELKSKVTSGHLRHGDMVPELHKRSAPRLPLTCCGA
jgi:hypothetical protein